MIDRKNLDLFYPTGTDTSHICRECRHCFSNHFTPHSSHCDVCGGVVDGLDYACENCFESGNNNGTYYTKEELVKLIKIDNVNGKKIEVENG